MEKETFHSLVKNYTSLTREEAVELISLQDHFPYSQVIHNLCSRAAQDHALDSREKLLHLIDKACGTRRPAHGIISDCNAWRSG